MRKTKEEAAKTRHRIVETASRKFRENGISETGLSELMAAAGLTQGGFYRHFKSKDHLVDEVCAHSCNALVDTTKTETDGCAERKGLKAVVDNYLSEAHRDDRADGCIFAGLLSDLARSGDTTRDIAAKGLMRLVDLVAEQYTDEPPKMARQRAMATVATMIGALSVARVVRDPKLSAAILESARRQILCP
jgi:TetR/AcrR family transcriptional regulator, transcriptional repressor for nem operon